MRLTVEIPEASRRVLDGLRPELARQATERALPAFGLGILRDVKINSLGKGGGRTGTMARSWRLSAGKDSLLFTNPAGYTMYQEHGTGTHAGKGKYPIPSAGKTLLAWRPGAGRPSAFKYGGGGKGWAFAMRVMHPGVPAKHMFRNAFRKNAERLASLIVGKATEFLRAG